MRERKFVAFQAKGIYLFSTIHTHFSEHTLNFVKPSLSLQPKPQYPLHQDQVAKTPPQHNSPSPISQSSSPSPQPYSSAPIHKTGLLPLPRSLNRFPNIMTLTQLPHKRIQRIHQRPIPHPCRSILSQGRQCKLCRLRHYRNRDFGFLGC